MTTSDNYNLQYRDIDRGSWRDWFKDSKMSLTEATQTLRSAQVAAVRDGLARDYRIITGKQ